MPGSDPHPEWCRDHIDSPRGGLHQSARKQLALQHRKADYGTASAAAVQLANYPGDQPGISLVVGRQPGQRYLEERFNPVTPETAELLAHLIEQLAPATYAQHVDLAAQIRAAAVIAFGAPRNGDADG